jgi:hypothetical protein
MKTSVCGRIVAGQFVAGHFVADITSQDFSSLGHFVARTFRREDNSSQDFSSLGLFVARTFRREDNSSQDFSSLGLFVARTFRRLEIFSTWVISKRYIFFSYHIYNFNMFVWAIINIFFMFLNQSSHIFSIQTLHCNFFN